MQNDKAEEKNKENRNGNGRAFRYELHTSQSERTHALAASVFIHPLLAA